MSRRAWCRTSRTHRRRSARWYRPANRQAARFRRRSPATRSWASRRSSSPISPASSLQWRGAEPRQCRPVGKRGAGPAADAELPQLRRRLSARQRADVPLMREPASHIPAISRAAGYVLVAAAIIAAAVQFHRKGLALRRRRSLCLATSRPDPLAAALCARCQTLGMAPENDAACQADLGREPPPLLQ